MEFKSLRAPFSNETRDIQAVSLWEVRWQSRYGEYSHDIKPEVECFTEEKDARDFYDAIRNAFKLIRHTACNSVSIEKIK